MRVLAAAALASIVAPAAVAGCLQLVGVSDWEGPQGAGGRDAGPDAAAPDADAAAQADTDGDAGLPPYVALVLSDHPVGYYRFEEMSPPTAHDAVRAAHDGVYHGILSGLGAAGIAGSFGIELDGLTDYVEIGRAFDFSGDSAFSAEIWVRPRDGGNEFEHLMGKLESANLSSGWALRLHKPPTPMPPFIIAARYANAAALCYLTSDPTDMSPLDQYTHVVMTFDGYTIRLYVNGVSHAKPCIDGGVPDTMLPFEIGVSAGKTYGFVKGTIDEAAIYDSVLAESRIKAHYEAGKMP